VSRGGGYAVSWPNFPVSPLPGSRACLDRVLPHAEFRFHDLMFQVDDGGDICGDGLWITPKDGLPHPVELREIREHVERLLLPT